MFVRRTGDEKSNKNYLCVLIGFAIKCRHTTLVSDFKNEAFFSA